MNKTVLKVFCVVVVLVMALSLVGCGGTTTTTQATASATASATAATVTATTAPAATVATEKQVLKVYAQYADDDTKIPYDYMLAALKKDMPNVELQLDVESQDDGAKLKTLAATGSLPDIFRAQGAMIQILKASKSILLLDEYADKTGFKAKMQDKAMNCLVDTDGHMYTFPYAGNEYEVLFYNKDVFSQNNVKVPTTFDELLAACKTFNSKNIVPLAIWAKEKWPPIALFDMIATRLDPKGITLLDTGKAKASDDVFKKAATKMAELVNAGLLPKGCTNMTYDQSSQLFYQGKAAMFISGQWEIDSSTKNLGDKVDWMYYPAFDAAGYESSKFNFSGSGGLNGFAVSNVTKDKDLATSVASYMAIKYAECKYTQRGNPLVATKVTLPIEKAYPPMMEKLAKDVPNLNTTAFDWYLTNPKIQAALEDECQRLCVPGASVDQFVKNIDKVIAASATK